ncbi:MAG: 50S ribosomal protein L17 [Chloroflexi bacterium]|nr:MAG: 50S ribosomal protein L17 [Chloroflexota bacterium]
MRHNIAGRRLGRSTKHRKALFRNLTTELFKHERIKTTEAKAKSIRPMAEKLISLARRDDVHARRLVAREIQDRAVVYKLFHEIGPRMQGRNGGYTRMYKLGPRRGDAAEMVLLELVDREED